MYIYSIYIFSSFFSVLCTTYIYIFLLSKHNLQFTQFSHFVVYDCASSFLPSLPLASCVLIDSLHTPLWCGY